VRKENFAFYNVTFSTCSALEGLSDSKTKNGRKLTSVCVPLPLPPPESIRSNADGIRWCCWTFFFLILLRSQECYIRSPAAVWRSMMRWQQ